LSNPYIQATPQQVEEMLEDIGAASIDEIFNDQIPAELQYKSRFDIPPALSELELQSHLSELAARNRAAVPGSGLVSFMGGGIYDHFVPSAIMQVAGRQEYVTGYTPYQPEASQGLLQAFFEYQTMLSRLYEMPVANASLYDAASAVGEAVFMALGIKTDRNRILLSQTIHPDYRELVATYMAHFGITVDTIPHENGITPVDGLQSTLTEDVAAVVVQHPNYFGCLEDAQKLGEIAHASGALFIVIADPNSLGVLAPPGTYDADIAVGEGQPLGLNPYAGGETVGIFTCKQEFIRRVPGRLVGLTKDQEDRRGFVLTLQTREQHIRRAKATSNICTNHAHNALRATIYMSLMGPSGMERVARASMRNTHKLRTAIAAAKPEAIVFNQPVFKEFVVRTSQPAEQVQQAMLERGFLAGTPLGPRTGGEFGNDLLLIAATEKRTDKEIEQFVTALGEFL
jgi:glycine dehydrogenase subunit 1